MKLGKQEPFERPDSGQYPSLLIDVIDEPQKAITYNGVTTIQDQITFVWTMNNADGTVAADSKGRPFRAYESFNAFINDGSSGKASKLYKALVQILNQAPPVLEDTDQIEKLVLGAKSNLMILTELKANGKDKKTSIIGHSPLKAGQVAPTSAPEGFVRKKNETKKPGQQAQRPAAPAAPQAPAAPPVDLESPDAF